MSKDIQWHERANEKGKDMSNSTSKLAEIRIEIKQLSHLPTSTGATSNERARNESKERKEKK